MRRVKKLFLLLLVTSVIGVSCGPKPYYKTREGKKKLKHYNSIQYDREHRPRKN